MKAMLFAVTLITLGVQIASDHIGTQDDYRYSQQSSNLETKSNIIRFT